PGGGVLRASSAGRSDRAHVSGARPRWAEQRLRDFLMVRFGRSARYLEQRGTPGCVGYAGTVGARRTGAAGRVPGPSEKGPAGRECGRRGGGLVTDSRGTGEALV